jgi:hypothetical protein
MRPVDAVRRLPAASRISVQVPRTGWRSVAVFGSRWRVGHHSSRPLAARRHSRIVLAISRASANCGPEGAVGGDPKLIGNPPTEWMACFSAIPPGFKSYDPYIESMVNHGLKDPDVTPIPS